MLGALLRPHAISTGTLSSQGLFQDCGHVLIRAGLLTLEPPQKAVIEARRKWRLCLPGRRAPRLPFFNDQHQLLVSHSNHNHNICHEFYHSDKLLINVMIYAKIFYLTLRNPRYSLDKEKARPEASPGRPITTAAS